MGKVFECSKEEWDKFFIANYTGLDVLAIYKFVADKLNKPSLFIGATIQLSITMVKIVDGINTIKLDIENTGQVTITCTEIEGSKSGSVAILPKNWKVSYPGSGHFQTKRTKQSRFEGRL